MCCQDNLGNGRHSRAIRACTPTLPKGGSVLIFVRRLAVPMIKASLLEGRIACLSMVSDVASSSWLTYNQDGMTGALRSG